MANSETPLLPEILWAQRHQFLFLTILVPSIEPNSVTLNISESQIEFKGRAGEERREYATTIQLFAPIDTEKSTHEIKARTVTMKLPKKTEVWWLRPSKDKMRNVKVDWELWREEDDPEIWGADIPIDIPEPEPPLEEDG